MNFMTRTIAAAVLLGAGVQAQAAVTYTVIDFDAVTLFASVNGFYGGGTDSASASGPNYGVTFSDFVATTGFGQTSQPNLAYSANGNGLIDVVPGFSSLSFTAGFFTPGTLSVWSGLGGTGTLLGSASGILGNPFAFTYNSVGFSGTAHSITLIGPGGQLGLDDLTLGSTVPEPASWALMIAGFGLTGFAMRRRVTALTA